MLPSLPSLETRQFFGLLAFIVGLIVVMASAIRYVHLRNRQMEARDRIEIGMASIGGLLLLVGVVLALYEPPSGKMASIQSSPSPLPPTATVIFTPTPVLPTPTASAAAVGSDWLNELKNMPPTKTWDFTQPSSEWAQNATCTFKADGYHVTATDQRLPSLCFDTNIDGATMALQATFQVVQGDSGGIIWHAAPPYNTNSKQVRIRFGQDGTFDCFVNPGDGSPNSNPIPSGPSTLIHQGHGQTNILTMIVKANVVAIFINGQYQGHGNDTVTDHGAIGVLAAKYLTDTEVVYTSAQFWAL